MAEEPSPQLVIFDIDGTLLATDDFWLGIGASAVATVYRRRGVERDLPPRERFLDAIGLPMPRFWKRVLPGELHHLAAEVEAEAQQLEEIAFGKGLGAMYPGARRLLDDLHAAGRLLGLASNCGLRYLEGFLKAFRLEPIVAEARCLDSPGISTKADMVGDILRCTGKRDAVMVGDREGDRIAARAHGVPFILFTGGFQKTDPGPGDRVAGDYGELREMLLPGTTR